MTSIPKQALVLVDGSSYLFRAYHALPPLTNSKGDPTGAIYGVINMLRKLLADYQPKYVAVVFDCKERTFRHEMFAEYKANRTVMPDELAVQIQPLHDLIRAMGLPLLAVPGVEADDVIGTLAQAASRQGLETVISTGDKDMAQLVDGKVICVNTMTDSILDHAGVVAKFGIAPEQIRDYLSLIGDSVDNIPGVYKVGPKTAVKWLEEYKDLDSIIAHADQISGKVGENLREAIPKLPLYKELITIKTDVDLNIKLEHLQQSEPNNALLRKFFTELEFKTWLKDLADFTPVHATPVQYELITKQDQFAAWIKKLRAANYFAFDLQSFSDNYMDAQIVGVSFSVVAGSAAYVPLAHNYEGAPKQLDREQVLAALRELLEDPAKLKIFHNLKYVLEVLANYKIKIAGTNFDTMLASYVLNSVGSRHNLSALAVEYLRKEVLEYEDVVGKGAKQISFDQVSLDLAGQYAAAAVDISLQLYQAFAPKLTAASKLQYVFDNVEMPLVPVLASMERHGVLINVPALHAQSTELGIKIDQLIAKAYVIAGTEFNLGSPKQLQEILFNKLQLPVLEKTPTGQPSTGEPVLQELAESYELPRIILEYRTLSKLKSTYTDKLPLEINAKTGRVHTSYQQAVTATGRLSSIDPNLQNIPIRTEEGKKIRAAFIAPPGYKIVAADYSQIELRIMAHLSEDEALINNFKNNLDIHRTTAAEVFGVRQEQVTHDQRRYAKAINFGLIYGMSAFGLAKQLGVSREEAQLYIDRYFERFPGVRNYMDRTRELAGSQGYVETMFGRRLYLPDIKSSKIPLRRAAERAAINAPLQGAQSDIIKIAMIKIFNWMNAHATDMAMIMQVHDELVFEIPTAKVEAYSKQIVDIMSNSATLDVQLDVDVGVGDNWDEAH